jgi:hypothetical protein
MKFIRQFVQFWIDFIIGDAWEVAVGIAVTLAAIALIADQWGGRQALSFALVAAILGVTWLALLRVTAGARRG